jgi:hypothetical protein
LGVVFPPSLLPCASYAGSLKCKVRKSLKLKHVCKTNENINANEGKEKMKEILKILHFQRKN